MFSRWIWGIFNTPKQSEIGWELPWVMHEIKDEDLLVNCMYACVKRHLKN